VGVWVAQYREEQVLNFTVFVLRVWGGQYREGMILYVTLCFVSFWVGNIEGN